MDYTQFTEVKPVVFTGGEEAINYWLNAGWKLLSISTYHKKDEIQATTTAILGRIDKHKLKKKE